MGIEDTLTFKGLEKISELIDTFEYPLLKGLAYIVLIIILLRFLWWFAITGWMLNAWKSRLIILGVWGIVEFAHFLGGGHN